MERDQALRAMECYDTFLEHYVWLLHHNLDNEKLRYPVVTKFHMMWHIVHISRYINPRFCWAYEFEDAMNTLVLAAKASLAGSPMKLIGNKVLENVYAVFGLEMKSAAV